MNQDILKAIAEQIPINRLISDRWAYTHRIAKRIYARLELLGVRMEITEVKSVVDVVPAARVSTAYPQVYFNDVLVIGEWSTYMPENMDSDVWLECSIKDRDDSGQLLSEYSQRSPTLLKVIQQAVQDGWLDVYEGQCYIRRIEATAWYKDVTWYHIAVVPEGAFIRSRVKMEIQDGHK